MRLISLDELPWATSSSLGTIKKIRNEGEHATPFRGSAKETPDMFSKAIYSRRINNC